MRKKALFLGVIGVAMVTAMLGMWRHTTPTSALIPRPIQPFNALALGGISTTQLGATHFNNYTVTQNLRGERPGVPWIFSGPGFVIDHDNAPIANVGGLKAFTDTGCASTSGAIVSEISQDATPGPAHDPFIWTKATTVVQGTSDDFLIPLMPPYSWVYRHNTALETFWALGVTPLPISPALAANTVYTNVPWSANGGAFTATTVLGGNPVLPEPPSGNLCSDTPQSSTSLDTQYSNPTAKGDSSRPIVAGTGSDGLVTGMWTANVANGAGTKTVTTKLVNNGPAVGSFAYLWDIEVTNPTVADANWLADGKVTTTALAAQPVGTVTTLTKDLVITCPGAGEGLVVLKGILWPVIPGTADPYPDDNTAIFVVQVICGSAGADPIDKEVIWIKTDPTVGAGLPGFKNGVIADANGWTVEGSKVEALIGGTPVSVGIDELKANHDVDEVDGNEWLVAETAAEAGLPAPIATWAGAVTVDPADGSADSNPTVTGGGTGTITYTADEIPGQTDVHAQLDILCPPAIPQGEYSVVVKGIDVPVGHGESKASDNANRSVITVFCWASPGDRTTAQDGIDDATGLYTRWTIFKAAADFRKPFKSPPSFTSDGGPTTPSGTELPPAGYVERKATLECFWEDADGYDGPAQADPRFITGPESLQDPDMPAGPVGVGADTDGDCLQDYHTAQPGHPTENELAQPGGNCAAVPWAEEPNIVVNSVAADNDCDGLLDGIERAYGSNPKLADSDGDTATDFQEIFQFTNPLNPDTDGDGFLDKPATRFNNDGLAADGVTVLAQDTSFDNCPAVANPGQENWDGRSRPNGPKVPNAAASNPTQDKTGDACDADDDNDGLTDVAEPLANTNPKNPNTDGDTIVSGAYDRCVDGVEVNWGNDPDNAAVKCGSFTDVQFKFYKACRINVVDDGVGIDGGLWDAKYSANPERFELDPDGDTVACLPVDSSSDKDNDDGNGVASPPAELADSIEIQGYYSNATNKDTDGDGCADWIEIMDINGDRKVSVSDQTNLAKRAATLPGFEPEVVSDAIYDVQKDGKISVADQTQMAKNVCGFKPGDIGCPTCPAEN